MLVSVAVCMNLSGYIQYMLTFAVLPGKALSSGTVEAPHEEGEDIHLNFIKIKTV